MKCKLCNNRVRKRKDRPRYYQCPVCDLIFLDRKFILDKEEEKDRYSQHNNTCENEGYVNMFRDFIDKTIIPYREDIDSALDFGCGPGPVLAQLLIDMGIKTDIYDPYFYPDQVYQENKYDLITSTEVFEHLQHPYEIIIKLKKHLKAGGILAVMTRLHDNVDQFSNWWYLKDPTHITFYSSETFDWIAENLSFDLTYCDNDRTVVLKKE